MFPYQGLDFQKGSGSLVGWAQRTEGKLFRDKTDAGMVSRRSSQLQTRWGGRGTQDLTWYVLSKLSYMNRVIRDVFPTAKQEEERGSAGAGMLDSSKHIPCEANG